MVKGSPRFRYDQTTGYPGKKVPIQYQKNPYSSPYLPYHFLLHPLTPQIQRDVPFPNVPLLTLKNKPSYSIELEIPIEGKEEEALKHFDLI